MSWQGYVDDQLIGSGKVDQAAIIDAASGGVVATSKGLRLSPPETQAITKAFNEPRNVFTSGLNLNGVKYVGIMANETSFVVKKGPEGVVAMKSNKFIVIGHFPVGGNQGEAQNVVSKLSDSLKENGY